MYDSAKIVHGLKQISLEKSIVTNTAKNKSVLRYINWLKSNSSFKNKISRSKSNHNIKSKIKSIIENIILNKLEPLFVNQEIITNYTAYCLEQIYEKSKKQNKKLKLRILELEKELAELKSKL